MLATLRNRNFALVWTAGFISMTGDWLLSIGLPIYVLTLTNSVLLTSIMFMVSFLPNLLFGSFAGVLVDRWDRKRTMVVASALQVLAILPLLFVTSADRAWIVFASGFAESTLGLFFTPAESALLPLLVDKERLASANALSGVNRNLARLLGPALGGLIIATRGLDGVILGDALSFGVAAFLIAPVRAPGHAAASEPANTTKAAESETPKRSILRELGEGLSLIRHSRPVAVLFAIAALTGVGEGLFGILLVVWTKRVLGGGALELGWMMSGQAVGGLLGGLIVAGLIAPRVRPARLLGVCLLLFGATDIAIVDSPLFAPPYLPPSPVPQITSSLVLLVVALFILVGIPSIGGQTGQTTLLQQAVPNTHLGRVMSLGFGLFALAMLVGMAIAGLLGDQLGSILLLNGQGGLYMCAGVLAILFLWGWRSAQTPAEEAATVAEEKHIASAQEALEPVPNSAAFDA